VDVKPYMLNAHGTYNLFFFAEYMEPITYYLRDDFGSVTAPPCEVGTALHVCDMVQMRAHTLKNNK
jgi:hypothetical protein